MWTQGTRDEAEGQAGAGAAEAAQGNEGAAEVGHSTSNGTSAADQAEERLAAAFAAHSGSPPPSPPPSATPPLAEPKFAPLGGPVRAAPGPAGQPGTWAPPTLGEAGPQHGQERDGRGRNMVLGVAAAALLLIAGGVGAALVLGGSGNASAQEAVANAAAQTNAQSADMSLSIDASILGMHENVSANGSFDFAHKLGTMTTTIPVNGTQYSEQEIIDGSTIYVNVGNLTGGLAPAKPWVSEDVGQVGNSSQLNTLDPTSMLRQLQSAGGTVTTVGPTTYDGTSVTEYAGTLPASVMMGEIGKLPASLQQGVSGLNLPDMHMDIYVTQDNLLKALSMPSYSISLGGQTMSMQMTMVLSNYGTTVNVTPPPADQVQPLPQLGGGGGGLGNSGSTGSTSSSV
jgi:hypothetical protein